MLGVRFKVCLKKDEVFIMEAEQILTGVANYGFPICISWYLLVRMEGKLDKLSLNIDNLTRAIEAVLR